MREKIAQPLQLSDDFENNLYRNVVHVLVECEKMIPGGQAERVISVVKALLREEIEKVANPYPQLEPDLCRQNPTFMANADGFERCRQAILAQLK